MFLFLYAPIFVLIVFSFNDSKSNAVWGGFTLDWYIQLFQDRTVLEAFQTTITVSVLATAVATVAGTAAAIGFYNMKHRARSVCMTVNNIPLTNPDIITGVSMMLLFVFVGQVLSDVGIDFGLGFPTLLIAHITFNIPYVILSVMPKLRQLDPNIAEAAQDLGATSFYAFRKVVLPELMPGIINGMLIAFTMSIDDFVISYFTAGSRVSTLSMVVYSMVRRRVSPEINALSTLMFLAVLVLLIVINLRQNAQGRSRRSPRGPEGSPLPANGAGGPLLSLEDEELGPQAQDR
ncbi:MAG TPA: ABC transporter permease [Candidatus Intestinimonas stercoravium]|uniref:ABC transporter permease n=1 Tax=uncultured Intestinimonas sp. TaxID=1689265 RepID=UPI001F9BE401|nr:ABC transporter permease [uncultured Intestinimonas sp.]HJA63338.1 ABC transporter permease [Candidatus Intestinimonas stercoravium]